jgi:hypothetical protein
MTLLAGRLQDIVRPVVTPGVSPRPTPAQSAPTEAPARAARLTLADGFELPLPGRKLPEGGSFGELKGFPFPGGIKWPPLPEPGTRLRSQALKEMDALLGGEPTSEPSEGGAEVTRDGVDVNSWRDTAPGHPRYEAATTQLKANEGLEQQQLGRLSPEQREGYLQVKAQLMAVNGSGDPVAALALQKLLFTGKLTDSQSLKGGTNVIDGLTRLTTAPLAEGLDRGQLLSDLVQELATPATIGQGDKGTCTVTSASIQLARKNPAEYVRLVTGLASPAGIVATASGTVLRREADSAAETGHRSEVQKLLAPALMEIANPRLDYRNDPKDGHYRGDKHKYRGLGPKELNRVLEALNGANFEKHHVGGLFGQSRKNAWKEMVGQLNQGKDVLAGLKWGDGGHEVLVTGTENINGKDYVRYINPWGREERISKDDFLDRLKDYHYQR